MHYEFSVEKAIAVLDKAGWKPGSDGIREKDGKKLKFVFQTSINQPRQKTQQIYKQACQKAGVDLDLKQVTASVYFSSDVGNPDTFSKFYADLQMYNTTSDTPDPALFMRNYLPEEAAQKENKWQGRNITRWQSPEYKQLWDKQQYELDPIKRAQLLIDCNDMVCSQHVVLPLVSRPIVRGLINKLHAFPSGFDSDFWSLENWWKDA